MDFLEGKLRRRSIIGTGAAMLSCSWRYLTINTRTISTSTNLHEVAVNEIFKASRALIDSFSAGHVIASAALFNSDAVFEDLALHIEVDGQIAITAYLQRTFSKLPYGVGANLVQVVGIAHSGGFEWRPNNDYHAVYGLPALEVNSSSLITRFTSVWDGSNFDYPTIQTLVGLTLIA